MEPSVGIIMGGVGLAIVAALIFAVRSLIEAA
jgi:hypothetical protein